MQEAEELYELREALEAFAVEKAIENLTDTALDQLREKMDLYGGDVRNRFTKERLMYDQNVHLEIAQLAGNEMLKSSLGHVFERIVLKRRTDGLYDAARGVSAHQQHLKLLRAMEQRNVTEAVTIVRAHIRKGKENVLADLKQRQAIRELPSNSNG
jgi:GntR family transcriptional repressor for pyruvate dehydrogenase complex